MLDWSTIISAFVGGGFALLGVIFNSKKQHNDTVDTLKAEIHDVKKEFGFSVDLIKKDIEMLEKKQDVHNSVVERVFQLEKTAEVLDERERVLYERLNTLSK